MATSPKIKVFDAAGNHEATVKHWESAAALVSFLGDGATIRFANTKRSTLWTEGAEADGLAGESYDRVADLCQKRQDEAYAGNTAKA